MQSKRNVRRIGQPVYSRKPTPRSRPRRARLQLSQIKLTPWSLGWGTFTLCVIAVLVVFALARVMTVKVDPDNASDSAKQIQQLGLSRAGSVGFGNIFLFDTNSLMADIEREVPSVDVVSVSRQLPSQINVVVAERQAVARYSSRGVIYVIDKEGTVIGQQTPSNARLPLLVDTTELPVQLGTRPVSAGFIRFGLDVITGLASQGNPAQELRIVETTTEVWAKGQKGYVIKFDTTRELREQLEAVALVQAQLTKQKKVPAEYIDVRVEGRAYFR